MVSTGLLILWLSCQTLDTATTYHLMGQVGFTESNPFYPSRRIVIGAKVSINGGVLWAWKRAKPQRNVIAGVMAAGGCIPGILNLRHY